VGLPEDVCLRARQILGSGASVVSQAVERLEQERAASARRSTELLASREELERERASLQRERERLRELERETRAGARAELIEDLRRRRDEIAALVARLQSAPAMAQAVDAQRAVEQAVAAEEREQARAVEPQALPEAALESGARVKHVRLGTEGVVLEVQDGTATVQMGALRSKVPVQDLLPIARHVRQAGFPKTKAERMERAEQARAAAVQVRVPVADVRGMRVDEALRAVELELDRATRAGDERVHVLHGHGSGALKAAVREHLQRSPYVRHSRPAEQHDGGDAVTIAELC
jgi:DNA mismatch repair protein MutS2